ncbi:MAG: hypothetical protein Q8Q35_00905 [Nanoarchaeota archaeon]|nr:hypothetical protein [Nanoarchaeota archaeon]
MADYKTEIKDILKQAKDNRKVIPRDYAAKTHAMLGDYFKGEDKPEEFRTKWEEIHKEFVFNYFYDGGDKKSYKDLNEEGGYAIKILGDAVFRLSQQLKAVDSAEEVNPEFANSLMTQGLRAANGHSTAMKLDNFDNKYTTEEQRKAFKESGRDLLREYNLNRLADSAASFDDVKGALEELIDKIKFDEVKA